MADWPTLDRELALWRREGRDLPIWWRDDDAVQATPALDRLLELSERLSVPLHLAVIPKLADESLCAPCAAPHVVPVVHGWAHANNAPAGAKKAEFGQDRPSWAGEASAGLDRLRGLFGQVLLPMFVPPWNRFHRPFVPALPDLGFVALSGFTPRRQRAAAPGLIEINTHIDPIDWRGGGGLVPVERLIAGLVTLLEDRRHGKTDAAEPLGLLTHHLVHDNAIWSFTERCLAHLLDGGATPVNLFVQQGDLP